MLHNFWFGELDQGIASQEKAALWFTPSDDFDQLCYQFRPALECLNPEAWHQDSKSQLALIILCDQIPRNIFRGTAMAYAYDSIALSTAKQGVERGLDLEMGLDERGFFYLPFEHSESMVDQHTAVALFSKLRDDAPQPLKNHAGNKLRHAQRHRDIVQRFGRFPHRNRVLERMSSQEELDFIRRGDGFGQG